MSEYICGRNSVLEALKGEREINRIYMAVGIEKAFAAQVKALCRDRGIPFDMVERAKLDKLAGPDHRGVAAQVAAVQYVEVEDILALARERNEVPFVLILAEVEDPQNLGAILRTADCAGVHGVIIPKRRAASLNQTVAKVAQGAAEHVPVARVANLVQAAKTLQEAGLWLVAAEMDGEPFWTVDFSGPIALVLGGEDRGVPALLAKQCDFHASIPLLGQISSLNVSAATAVLLYEVVRRRLTK